MVEWEARSPALHSRAGHSWVICSFSALASPFVKWEWYPPAIVWPNAVHETEQLCNARCLLDKSLFLWYPKPQSFVLHLTGNKNFWMFRMFWLQNRADCLTVILHIGYFIRWPGSWKCVQNMFKMYILISTAYINSVGQNKLWVACNNW